MASTSRVTRWPSWPGPTSATASLFPRFLPRPSPQLLSAVYGTRHGPHEKSTACWQTPGALDAIAEVLSDTTLDNLEAREYAAISIGNCGANSEEGAETIVKNTALMDALILCLGDDRQVRIQETTVVALKNCAASSQEAAYLIAQDEKTLHLLKNLSLQDGLARLRDVVSSNPSLYAFFLSRAQQ